MSSAIHRSPLPDVALLDVDLISYLFSNPYNVSHDRKIFIDAISGRFHTYDDVLQRTRSLASGLRQLGVQAGDTVAMMCPNSIDYPIICYGIIGAGATVSPSNAAYTREEVHHQLQTTRAKYVIVHSSLAQTVKDAAKGTSVQNVIIQAANHNPSAMDGVMVPTVEDLMAQTPTKDLVTTPTALLDERPAFICFSSGTTGPAKGVITTHRNIVSNLQQWDAHNARGGSKLPTASVAFLPFSHIYGISYFVCGAMIRGMTTAVMARFDLDVYLTCIQTIQPEELAVVPPIILLLVKDPRVEKYDLSSVRKILSAAAPLGKELAEALEARFRKLYGTTVYCHQSWGLTETSPLATGVPPERMVDKRHTVGCITPNMQFRFIDPETMQDVDMTIQDNGQLPLAEILCRGPNVTKGYLGNESATKDLFHVDSNGDKWMRTGDIATIDQDGYITIHDRIKEMIKYKGLQVIPSELEGKLLEHPDVDDCGVTSRYVEDQATELPVAFVVLTSQARSQPLNAVATNLDQWINERVANHKRLRGGIHFIDAIPKSPSGKILRRKLKELARNRAASKL
ncbi:hypothetical protein N7474_009282 [Penicillium riverlandense]|uniref:uncharacterized protein n=1 Tax=Penicillium riverlandense TaxID=1903569 RepID=UPI002548DA1E|nr:uncharacterized protein N7474_009282 [Penicillium riverlandense]KAJ5808013.1 hypothetical protein N7474_009282 [Penicillium riverlandense]